MLTRKVRKLENGQLVGCINVDRHFTDQAQKSLHFLEHNPFAVDLNQEHIGHFVIPAPWNDRPILVAEGTQNGQAVGTIVFIFQKTISRQWKCPGRKRLLGKAHFPYECFHRFAHTPRASATGASGVIRFLVC